MAVSHHLKPISSGVPQGSVLGPLLFILHFRDIPSVVSSTCALFADDTLLYDRCYGVCTEQPCCRLEEDVRSLDTWAGGWCTTFNASKSAHMFISSKHRRSGDTSRSSLSLSGGIIPLVRTTAHLGVRISSTLSWSDHVSNIIRRVKFTAISLKRLARRHRSADLDQRLYCCLVRPVLEYAVPVWDACSQHDTIAMEHFQLSIARAILHVRRRQTHNVDVLATICWPTLAWRCRRQKLSSLWDLLHGGGPPSLHSQVPSPVSSRCSYSFRNPLTLSLPSCRTSRRWKSFLPSSVALFNSLPISVVCCSSMRSFLLAVDKFFLPDKFSYGLSLVSTFSYTFFP